MNTIEIKFSEFFGRQYETRPEVRLPSSGSHPSSIFEQARAQIFAQEKYKISQITGSFWDQLTSSVYKLQYLSLSTVVAIYPDETILWLDDHSSDLEFEEFSRREQLFLWLSGRVSDLVDLLIATKLNYLGGPLLVKSVSDIPQIRDIVQKSFEESEEGRHHLRELDRRLSDVSDQIENPKCVVGDDGQVLLTFYIWTKFIGKIIRVECFRQPDTTLQLKGTQLVQEVGQWMTPR